MLGSMLMLDSLEITGRMLDRLDEVLTPVALGLVAALRRARHRRHGGVHP
jgi:hypothetical protein